MNVERLAEEYVKRKELADALAKEVSTLKEMLSKAIDEQGIPDEKGHLWLDAGKYSLQRQKRQGDKYLDRAQAEAWAKEEGFWNEVKLVREDLDEDALLGYVFERRKAVPGIEERLEELYVEPPVTWALQKPVLQENYDY
jgi:hypothetical protein